MTERMTKTEWELNRISEYVGALKKAFVDLANFVDFDHDSKAVAMWFDDAEGKESYPFSESFEEVVMGVLRWNVGGTK